MSQKEFVIQRMAQLESGQIPRRGPGRPRGPNYGKPWQSKADPNNPLSVARSEAGKKGRAVTQTRHMLEAERKKLGRTFQAEFDKDLEQVKAELINYYGTLTDSFVRTRLGGKQDAEELLGSCCTIIEGLGWNRSYYPPEPYESYVDEYEALLAEAHGDPRNIKPESWRSFGAYPEVCADWVIALSRCIKLEELRLLKQLAVRALDSFITFASRQKDHRVLAEIESTVGAVERAIPKVKDGSIYNPPPPREPDPVIEDTPQSRRKNTRGVEVQVGETLAENEQRLLLEQEQEILRQKAWQERQAQEREQQEQQRRLLGFDVNSILHADIFGATPQRR